MANILRSLRRRAALVAERYAKRPGSIGLSDRSRALSGLHKETAHGSAPVLEQGATDSVAQPSSGKVAAGLMILGFLPTRSFNSGDEDGLAACFADCGFIFDGMAPHVWSGPSSTRDWHRDAMVEAGHVGITDFNISLGKATHDVALGDAGYFVAPATLRFKVQGQQIIQSGASLTVALRPSDDSWRIAAWLGRREAAAAQMM